MTAAEMVNLVIGIGSLSLALLALASLLIYVLITWSARRRNDRYDRYWYSEDFVSTALAAVGAEARAGCSCEGCEHLRQTAVEVMFHVTDDDIAELNRYGIAWETK